MTDFERDLQEMMRRRADAAWRSPSSTLAVVRRARRRRVGVSAAVLAAIVVTTLGGLLTARSLQTDTTIEPANPTSSPTGIVTKAEGQLAFVDVELDASQVATQNLYVVPAAGGPARRLQTCTDSCRGSGVIGAAWSPDGSQIAYSVGSTTSASIGELAGIYVLNVDSGLSHQVTMCLTPCTRQGAGIDWSPDGSLIAYDEARNGLCESAWGFAGSCTVHTISPDGTSGTELDTGSITDPTGPSWSPDGTAVAVSGRVEDEWFGYSVPLDDSPVTELTSGHPSREAVTPAWSPDGETVAFQVLGHSSTGQPSSTSCEIWTVGVDGSNADLLLDACSEPGPGGASGGRGVHWSPDGSALGYYRDGLRMVKRDGTGNARVVVTGANPATILDWGPP